MGGTMITAMRCGCRRSALVAFHFLTIAIATGASFGPVLAQQAEPSDRHWQQSKYFHDQRAFPLDRIPPGAYQKARQDYESKWGSREQQPAPQINANGWTAIGPDHIATTPTTNGRTN